MWDWLKAYKASLYDTFWIIQGQKEYEKIYSIRFEDELKKRNMNENNTKEFREILKNQYSKATYHFGDPHFNLATIAGLLRMAFKEYDKAHNIKVEKNNK